MILLVVEVFISFSSSTSGEEKLILNCFNEHLCLLCAFYSEFGMFVMFRVIHRQNMNENRKQKRALFLLLNGFA